jgi:hypothetical protein
MADSAGRYGKTHRALREHWKRVIDGGGMVACWRCGDPIRHGMTWHLGHSDDGSRHMGPEHAKCNLRAQNELRAADARRWREERAADRLEGYRRILAADPSAYEHPDWPGLIVRPW